MWVANETDWLRCKDPREMLHCLRGKATGRKMRLFAVACSRRLWHVLTDARSRDAVDVAERFADGSCSEAERHTAAEGAYEAYRDAHRFRTTSDRSAVQPLKAAEIAYVAVGEKTGPRVVTDIANACAQVAGERTAAHRWRELDDGGNAWLLRELFGNPFRPVAADPSWLTSTVVEIAAGIYADRAFDRLPILADALQEAGCNHAGILTHCRQDWPHVRGCWVVDAVLGKV